MQTVHQPYRKLLPFCYGILTLAVQLDGSLISIREYLLRFVDRAAAGHRPTAPQRNLHIPQTGSRLDFVAVPSRWAL